jgi:hypothetical protein
MADATDESTNSGATIALVSAAVVLMVAYLAISLLAMPR